MFRHRFHRSCGSSNNNTVDQFQLAVTRLCCRSSFGRVFLSPGPNGSMDQQFARQYMDASRPEKTHSKTCEFTNAGFQRLHTQSVCGPFRKWITGFFPASLGVK